MPFSLFGSQLSTCCTFISIHQGTVSDLHALLSPAVRRNGQAVLVAQSTARVVNTTAEDSSTKHLLGHKSAAQIVRALEQLGTGLGCSERYYIWQ